jgi:hypothetical protein
MADDDDKLDSWNVRKFPRELKLECQSRVKKSGMREPRWLAEILCTALDLPRDVYLDPIYVKVDMLDSAHEDGQGAIRRSSAPNAKQTSPEKRKDKGTKKGKKI